jgi:hypothetical protein
MAIDPRTDDASFEHVMAGIDKPALSAEGKQQMFLKDHRIGIDSGTGMEMSDEASEKDDWGKSITNMKDLRRDGGLVYVPANNTPGTEEGLIGQVPAGSDIELKDYPDDDGGTVTMKTLKLQSVRAVHPDDDTNIDEVKTGRYTVHSLDTHRDKVVAAYEELY